FASLLVMLHWLRVAEFGHERPAGDAALASERRWTDRHWGYVAGLAFFLLAMLSKTIACCLPVVLVLLVWWKRGGLDRRAILGVAPFFAIGLALGLHTVYIERSHVGAVGQDWQFE